MNYNRFISSTKTCSAVCPAACRRASPSLPTQSTERGICSLVYTFEAVVGLLCCRKMNQRSSRDATALLTMGYMRVLGENELQDILTWVDQVPLSREKRNLSRDFSDGGKYKL